MSAPRHMYLNMGQASVTVGGQDETHTRHGSGQQYTYLQLIAHLSPTFWAAMQQQFEMLAYHTVQTCTRIWIGYCKIQYEAANSG